HFAVKLHASLLVDINDFHVIDVFQSVQIAVANGNRNGKGEIAQLELGLLSIGHKNIPNAKTKSIRLPQKQSQRHGLRGEDDNDQLVIIRKLPLPNAPARLARERRSIYLDALSSATF